MDYKLDDLIHSINLSRAYEKYNQDFKESNNELVKSMQNQLKESFLSGYNEGYKHGEEDGIMDVKFKVLVKLAAHTDLDDQVILKVLEKEGEENYIDALKQVREKQNEQK